jgi:hypothetical protein
MIKHSTREAVAPRWIVSNVDRARLAAGEDFIAFFDDPIRRDQTYRRIWRVAQDCVKIGEGRMRAMASADLYRKVVSMAHKLRYGLADENAIWTFVHDDLPKLRAAAAGALAPTAAAR